MSNMAVSFGKKQEYTTNSQTEKNKKSKKNLDVQILTDNNEKIIIKAREDLIKVRIKNKNNPLLRVPQQDEFTPSRPKKNKDDVPVNKNHVYTAAEMSSANEETVTNLEEEGMKAVNETEKEDKSEIENTQPDKIENKDAATNEKEETKDENSKDDPFYKGLLNDVRKELAPKLARLVIAVCTVALSSLGLKVGTDKLNEMPQDKYIMYDNNTNDISDIAETYNVNEDMMFYINDINNKTDLNNIKQLKIPTPYDYLEESVQDLTKNLYKSKNDVETQKLSKELDAVIAKRKEQKEVASTYTDGEFVYICLNDFSDNKELQQKYEGLCISADKIQSLFDIKDGELKKYNTIDNAGYKLDENNQKVFADFGYPVVPSGTILKVSKNAINIENPNLNDYTEQTDTKTK